MKRESSNKNSHAMQSNYNLVVLYFPILSVLVYARPPPNKLPTHTHTYTPSHLLDPRHHNSMLGMYPQCFSTTSSSPRSFSLASTAGNRSRAYSSGALTLLAMCCACLNLLLC